MFRFIGRPRLDVFGLYGRGPLINVPALFLVNPGCGAADGPAELVDGGLGVGFGTVKEA